MALRSNRSPSGYLPIPLWAVDAPAVEYTYIDAIGFSLLNNWGIEDIQALVGIARRAEA